MTGYQSLTREEIIEKLDNKTLSDVNTIRHAIKSMKMSVKGRTFNSIKVGDVWNVKSLGSHPAVVISIKKEKVFSLFS